MVMRDYECFLELGFAFYGRATGIERIQFSVELSRDAIKKMIYMQMCQLAHLYTTCVFVQLHKVGVNDSVALVVLGLCRVSNSITFY